MGLSSDHFCDCVCKCGIGVDIEDWIRIFAVIHTACGKDDGDEVDACVLEKRRGA